MIIIRIQAGLGNQISQYAFSRYLALKGLCDDIKLDFSYFLEDGGFPYEMENAFDKKYLVFKRADENDIRLVTKMRGAGRKRTAMEKIINYSVRYIQKACRMDPNIIQKVEDGYSDNFDNIDWNRNLYFNGTWHNIDYTECLEQLKRELIFNADISKLLDDSWKSFFKHDELIAIHVRMGDYMRHGDEHNILIDSNYYHNAINGMMKKYNKAKFVLFSNEKQKAFEIIKPIVQKNEIQVFSQNVKDWEEMYLMTQCKGVICANSTFSYWGGLLGYDKEKTIMFPEYYAKNRKAWTNPCIESIPLY